MVMLNFKLTVCLNHLPNNFIIFVLKANHSDDGFLALYFRKFTCTFVDLCCDIFMFILLFLWFVDTTTRVFNCEKYTSYFD